jgi:hypothetical protein
MMNPLIRSNCFKTVLSVTAALAWFDWALSSVAATLSREDQALLEDISHRSFQFFWEQALVPRTFADWVAA